MNVRNIIFDLGGVVLDIDYLETITAFSKAGITNASEFYSKQVQLPLFDRLETGDITEEEFFEGIRKESNTGLSNEMIRQCWNALLIGLPKTNVELLLSLKKNFQLFLLSNTNEIHEKAYQEIITNEYGSFILGELFEKMYLSHRIHLRKPHPEAFQFVMKDAGIHPSETLFIDDSPQHIKGAQACGIQCRHLEGMTLEKLLSNLLT